MTEVIVIGAGVIGISAALQLQLQGCQVTVLDRAGVAGETSAGNAGAWAFTVIEPMATPGILRQAPKWMLDPLGPLSVPPAYLPRLAPWLWQFWRASLPGPYRAGAAAQAALMDISRSAFEDQVAAVDGESFVRREGQLVLYEGERQFRASASKWELSRAHGINFRLLETPDEIAEIQPGLSPRFTHAGFTPDWYNVTDPKLWVEHLAARLVALGGRIEREEVRAVPPLPGGGVRVSAGTEREVDHVIIAAGAWSHHLTAALGDPVPLETERGYNTTFASCALDLRCHLTFGGHGFAVSRIGDGVRVGGAVEFAGLKRPPNYARAEALLRKAKAFLPGLEPKDGVQWMGHRPSLPDTLPVIGPSRASRAVTYAFGHGHLGLTQSAGTAALVADLVMERAPSIDLTPYRADRF